MLNAAKTELMWCVPPRQQDCLPNAALRVGSDSVQPVRCVRDLRIYIDSDISMRTHITHHENSVELLFCSSTASNHSEVHQPACAAVTGYVTDRGVKTIFLTKPVTVLWRPVTVFTGDWIT